jgi:hypothetical protein
VRNKGDPIVGLVRKKRGRKEKEMGRIRKGDWRNKRESKRGSC